ncbi:nucleotide-binding universal stress UspA family protein [Catenulispora sp. MAP12-49]|uniref:universal stress protein n=1 Tax=Catenulispora sp. MAP12-49 TaxID=3156302 RepID=UPI0035172F1B
MRPSIVVGYDQMPQTLLALDEAAAEADRRAGVLTVVHAFQRATWAARPGTEPISAETAHAGARRIAERGADHVRSRHPGLEVRTLAAEGSTATVLTEAARDADLLVVGCHGHVAGLVLGSVTARVATRPGRPTMIVRGGRHEPRGTVLAAVDIDEPADRILAFAFDDARLRRTGLKAISVRESFWPRTYAGDTGGLRAASIQGEDNADLTLQDLLRPWQAEYPEVHVRRELADGPAATILIAASSHADVIVAGAHHHSTQGRPTGDAHLGPTIHPLLLRTDCPVVIVPHSPVRAGPRSARQPSADRHAPAR